MSSLKEHELIDMISLLANAVFEDEVARICDSIDCMVSQLREKSKEFNLGVQNKEDMLITIFECIPAIYRLYKVKND